MEKEMQLCRQFMSGAAFQELIASISSVKYLLAFGEEQPRFDLYEQIQLAIDYKENSSPLLNNVMRRPDDKSSGNLFKTFVDRALKCTKASSYAKLQDLDRHLVKILRLVDPNGDYIQDLSPFMLLDHHRIDPREE